MCVIAVIGSGGGPTECYNEGDINNAILDYDYSGILNRVEGPIETCVNGQYESLCDIGWDEVDAQAICRQLVGSDNGMHMSIIEMLLIFFCPLHSGRTTIWLGISSKTICIKDV